jgi:hypothetical protein
MRKIVLLSGYISSGKDCVADFLVKTKNYRKYALADYLKTYTAFKYDFPVSLTKTHQGKRAMITMLDNVTEVSVRELLISEGEQLRKFRESIFVDKVIERINMDDNINYQNIVISDFRFPNEYKNFKDAFPIVKTVRINRPDVDVPIFESEHLLDDFKFDKYIQNDKGLNELYEYISESDFF